MSFCCMLSRTIRTVIHTPSKPPSTICLGLPATISVFPIIRQVRATFDSAEPFSVAGLFLGTLSSLIENPPSRYILRITKSSVNSPIDCKRAEICYNSPTMTKYITSTPGIIGGKPAIAGTRIPISRIIYLLSQGYTVDTIHDDYPWVQKKVLKGVIDEIA